MSHFSSLYFFPPFFFPPFFPAIFLPAIFLPAIFSRQFFPPVHYIYICRVGLHCHCTSHICNVITLSHGFHRSTNPQGGGGALRLELPLPAGLLCPRRLDTERRGRAGSSCPSRCGALDSHHEPLLLRAHAGAAEESQMASRLFPYLGSLLRRFARDGARQARGVRHTSS